jgi:antitoxin (DNA-binding transcriptional repressor) of toxin-antitoxin stability system
MRSVGIKSLKDNLSEYVRLAASGETVLVTDRERVVAELSPPRPERSPLLADALLGDLVRHGWLRPPLLCSPKPPRRATELSLAELLQGLAEDREDR